MSMLFMLFRYRFLKREIQYKDIFLFDKTSSPNNMAVSIYSSTNNYKIVSNTSIIKLLQLCNITHEKPIATSYLFRFQKLPLSGFLTMLPLDDIIGFKKIQIHFSGINNIYFVSHTYNTDFFLKGRIQFLGSYIKSRLLFLTFVLSLYFSK